MIHPLSIFSSVVMATVAKSPSSSRSGKVVAGMKGLLKSATNEIKQNSSSLKEDMIDVLEAARLRRRVGGAKEGKTGRLLDHSFHPDAGSEILTHYKEDWSAIHIATQESSAALTGAEVELQDVQKSIAQSHAILSRCCDEFVLLADVVTAVDSARVKVAEIGLLLKQVEESITEYSRVSAQLECERRQHSLKIQDERHRKVKEDQVRSLTSAISAERRMIAEQEREGEARKVQERQQAFQDMFDQQMKEYRTRGEVERAIGVESRQRTSSQLEDVVIEDEGATSSLHEFLSDVVVDESDAGNTAGSPEPSLSPVSSGDGRLVEEPVVKRQEVEVKEEKREEGLAETNSEEELFEDAED